MSRGVHGLVKNAKYKNTIVITPVVDSMTPLIYTVCSRINCAVITAKAWCFSYGTKAREYFGRVFLRLRQSKML